MTSFEEIQQIFDSDIRDDVIHGDVVLAGTPEKELSRMETGIAQPGQGIPMHLDTVIDIASLTKVVATITSLLIAHSRNLTGKVLLHSGWSGQSMFMNFETNMYAIVLTTRCGDYARAKTHRFEIFHKLNTYFFNGKE